CERKIRQIHHIAHWSNGGPTNLDNLVGLCWEHHRLVHEGNWTIEGNPNREITFISPNKRRRLPSRPPPTHPKLRTQLRRINHGHLRPPRPDVARRRGRTTAGGRARRRKRGSGAPDTEACHGEGM
ncbi:MAG: HNH endonuclease signature motif containing protein, partial [Acidimicrobiales bacterium]